MQKFNRLPSPDGIRREYYATLRRTVLKDAKALVNEAMKPELERLTREASKVATNDARLDVNAIMDGVRKSFAALWPSKKLKALSEKIAISISGFQKRQLNAELKKFFGVDPIKGEPWLDAAIAEFTTENVALIKTIPSRYFDDIEKVVAREVADGARASSIAKVLQERYGVSEYNAARIARDQVGKFYGDLNRVRQQELGLEEYIWRTVRDNRVREEHEALEGQRFSWKSPPSEGTPGEAINCRCYAEPVIKTR